MRSIDSDLRGLEDKREVFVAEDQPFEKPAKEFVPGPFFVNIEEALPELAEDSSLEDSSSDKKLAVDRRDLMRLFGAGAMMASAAACVRRPVEHAIPYVTQPKDAIVGVPTYFATTIDRVGVVVKTREGRPVFLEGNPEHPLSQGAASMIGMSELQALYHPERAQSPKIRFGDRLLDSSWDDTFLSINDTLKAAKNVGILVKGSTGNAPQFYKDFLKQIGHKEENVYLVDSNAYFNQASEAHRLAFGVDGMPRSDIRRSKLLVGIGSDFMESTSPGAIFESKSWTAAYTFRNGQKSRYVAFESRLTTSGTKANQRHLIGIGDELGVTLAFVEALLAESGAKGSDAEKGRIRAAVAAQKALIDETKTRLGIEADLQKLAAEAVRGGTIVLAGESGAFGENGTQVQLAAIMANVLVGAYADKLLYFDQGWFKNPSRPGDLTRFFNDVATLDTIFIINLDPAFTLPKSFGFAEAMAGKNVITMNSMGSETDRLASHILNTHNPLESWGDEELVAGFWSIQQPTVRSISNSRQAEDILLWIAAKAGKPMGFADYHAYIRTKWEGLYKGSGITKDFDTFFKAIQRKGFYVSQLSKREGTLALADVSASFKPVAPAKGLKLMAHLDQKLGDGYGADRPVLQETGDSLTTIAWDTWVAINPHTCKELGLKYNDLVRITTPAGSLDVSVYPMPGLHRETVAIPRGRGQKAGVSKITDGIGLDPLVLLEKRVDALTGDPVTAGQTVKIEKLGKRYRLAAMQKHNDIANRKDIMPVLPLKDAIEKQNSFKDLDDVPDLYPSHQLKNPEKDLRGKSWLFPMWKASDTYRWGMSIDLDRCTGCGHCNVACYLENNIPYVGREQILIGREMTWIRIDRYWSGSVDNPETSFQPVPCQHCNHAPCEAVCPVFATTHDEEGFNAQTYNRCVGTRYCGNACPYKVRRFNWYTHKWNVMGDRPVDRNPRALNPDVTVRTRGIMEKCSFCVQRIRDAKHNAKQQERKVTDGEVRVACQVACPSDAITFGNLHDPNSRIARNRRDNRSYLLLNGDVTKREYGIKTLPNVNYMMVVRHDGTESAPAAEMQLPPGHP